MEKRGKALYPEELSRRVGHRESFPKYDMIIRDGTRKINACRREFPKETWSGSKTELTDTRGLPRPEVDNHLYCTLRGEPNES